MFFSERMVDLAVRLLGGSSALRVADTFCIYLFTHIVGNITIVSKIPPYSTHLTNVFKWRVLSL